MFVRRIIVFRQLQKAGLVPLLLAALLMGGSPARAEELPRLHQRGIPA